MRTANAIIYVVRPGRPAQLGQGIQMPVNDGPLGVDAPPFSPVLVRDAEIAGNKLSSHTFSQGKGPAAWG